MIHNMNKYAAEVAKREGGKKSLSIGQIKEVLAHSADIQNEIPGAADTWSRYCTMRFRRAWNKYYSKGVTNVGNLLKKKGKR